MSQPQDDGPRDDPMAPPAEPCECECLHCGRVFMSDRMWFQRVINSRDGFPGFWMCPTPNCSGAGFCFDIFPTDPDHPANAGWHYCDDEEDWEEDDEEGEWDETEDKYREMDEEAAAEGDIEGEEWKHGAEAEVAPLEDTEERWRMREEWEASQREARAEWEAEQRRYDEPDERPRVLDWSDRPERGEVRFGEDDIPF